MTAKSGNATFDDITIGNSLTEVDVSFTGIQLNALDIRTLAGAEDVELIIVESTIKGYPYYITDTSGELDLLVMIGNTIASAGTHTYTAMDIVITGNQFLYPSATAADYVKLHARDTAHFIGNEVIDNWSVRTRLLALNSGQNFVIANRFVDSNLFGSLQSSQH